MDEHSGTRGRKPSTAGSSVQQASKRAMGRAPNKFPAEEMANPIGIDLTHAQEPNSVSEIDKPEHDERAITERAIEIGGKKPSQTEVVDQAVAILSAWCEEAVRASHWVIARWHQVENRIVWSKLSGSVPAAQLQSTYYDEEFTQLCVFPSNADGLLCVVPASAPGTHSKREVVYRRLLGGVGVDLDPNPSAYAHASFSLGEARFTAVFAVADGRSFSKQMLLASYTYIQGRLQAQLAGIERVCPDHPCPEIPNQITGAIESILSAVQLKEVAERRTAFEECVRAAVNLLASREPLTVLVHHLLPEGAAESVPPVIPDSEFNRLDVYRDNQSTPSRVDIEGENLESIVAFAAKYRISLAFHDLQLDNSQLGNKIRPYHMIPDPTNSDDDGPRAYFAALVPWIEIEGKRLQVNATCVDRFLVSGESKSSEASIGRLLRVAQRLLLAYHVTHRLWIAQEPKNWVLNPNHPGGVKEPVKLKPTARLQIKQRSNAAQKGWKSLSSNWKKTIDESKRGGHHPLSETLMDGFCEYLRREFNADLCYFLRWDYPSRHFLPHGIACKTSSRDLQRTIKESLGLGSHDHLREDLLTEVLRHRLMPRRSGRTWALYNGDTPYPKTLRTDDPRIEKPESSPEGYSYDRLQRCFRGYFGWPFGPDTDPRPSGVVWVRWCNPAIANSSSKWQSDQLSIWSRIRPVQEAYSGLYSLLRMEEEAAEYNSEHAPEHNI